MSMSAFCICADGQRGQKMESNLLELELLAVVSHLKLAVGIELESATGAATVLRPWAISPASYHVCFKNSLNKQIFNLNTA